MKQNKTGWLPVHRCWLQVIAKCSDNAFSWKESQAFKLHRIRLTEWTRKLIISFNGPSENFNCTQTLPPLTGISWSVQCNSWCVASRSFIGKELCLYKPDKEVSQWWGAYIFHSVPANRVTSKGWEWSCWPSQLGGEMWLCQMLVI